MTASSETAPAAGLGRLFEPMMLRNVQVHNRVVMTGHGPGMANDYLSTEQQVASDREQERGGVGLIGMAFPQMQPTSQDVPSAPRAYDPAIGPGMRRITDAVHEYGAKIVMQLAHGGRQGRSTFPKRALWAPSNISRPFDLGMPKEMEPEDIGEIIALHVLRARHAEQAGMDGVEIPSGYGVPVTRIGDAIASWTMMDAMHEGERVARDV